jgi:hypothetical protein
METALTGSPFHMIDLNHFRDKEDAGWRGIVNQEVVSAMGERLSAFDTMGVRSEEWEVYGWRVGRCTVGEWGGVRLVERGYTVGGVEIRLWEGAGKT